MSRRRETLHLDSRGWAIDGPTREVRPSPCPTTGIRAKPQIAIHKSLPRDTGNGPVPLATGHTVEITGHRPLVKDHGRVLRAPWVSLLVAGRPRRSLSLEVLLPGFDPLLAGFGVRPRDLLSPGSGHQR